LLREAENGRLDAEQRFRLRAIIQSLAEEDGDDTVDRVSGLLAVDPYLWLALLERASLEARQIAAERLEGLLGEPVDFDPEADAETRRTQRERLLEQIRRVMTLDASQ
ncbi:MAG TPA: hypothetical protein VG713_10150, partial [Pirellulales bacterium]|nr:hypothetical protein [Pirellulales bacterium]